nr:hypothetical protein [Mycoplasmopsis bovis]
MHFQKKKSKNLLWKDFNKALVAAKEAKAKLTKPSAIKGIRWFNC